MSKQSELASILKFNSKMKKYEIPDNVRCLYLKAYISVLEEDNVQFKTA